MAASNRSPRKQEWSQRNDRDNFVKRFPQSSQGHNQQRSGDNIRLLLPCRYVRSVGLRMKDEKAEKTQKINLVVSCSMSVQYNLIKLYQIALALALWIKSYIAVKRNKRSEMSSHRNDNGCCLCLVYQTLFPRLAMLKPKQEEAGRGRSQVMVLVTRGSSLVTRGEGHLARQQQPQSSGY